MRQQLLLRSWLRKTLNLSKKFQIAYTKGSGLDASNYTVTISNPANNIDTQSIEFLTTALEASNDGTDFTLKSAKYIDTSETYVYPAAWSPLPEI